MARGPTAEANRRPPSEAVATDQGAGNTTWPAVPGYEIVGVLGKGGMAIVYKARHLRLNRIVALKMIAPGAYADLGQRERFQREAEAAACLQHANIVQVHEVGEWRAEGGNLPVPYFSLEFVD